jgi:hypothetical protein
LPARLIDVKVRSARAPIAAALLALLPVVALAETDLKPEASLTVWAAAGHRVPVDSSLNPENAVLRLPQWLGTVETRTDVRLTWRAATLVARPKLVLSADYTDAVGEAASRTDTSATVVWPELFATYAAADRLAVTYGLQNFQWGPAEAAGPSNRIFRDTVQAKDVLYDVKGRHLLRVNLTPERDWTEVLLLEITGNGDPEFEAGEPFSHKALLKSELAWNGSADYAGFVVGWREGTGAWLGEYLSVGLTGGLSAYLDASHQQGSLAWYPDRGFAQSRKSDSRIYTFSVAGLRYAFENGNDLRVEWVYQEAGYSADETAAAWSILRDSPQAAATLQHSGLEFPGRQYAFASFRVPDLLAVKNWQVYARCLVSLQDGSLAAYLSTEAAVGSAGTAFAGVMMTGGSDASELRGALGTAITIGYRHAW